MHDVDILHTIETEKNDPRSRSLDTLSTLEFVSLMHTFDQEAMDAVQAALPQVAAAIDAMAQRVRKCGRVLYIGAGTSGRLGVLDASECPPTFGVPPSLVYGIIAGGDEALRNAIEGAEDDEDAAKGDLMAQQVSDRDVVVAISASGYAPYCIGGLQYAREIGALTVSIACNRGARMSAEADIAIEAPTGAEILSGSTRLKAGTATKMILNMISTGIMIRNGKVYKNLMVDLRATNAKLKDRVVRIVVDATGLSMPAAEALLDRCDHDPKVAIVMHETGKPPEAAREALTQAEGFISKAVEMLKEA